MRTVRVTLTVKIDEAENGLTEDDFDPAHLGQLMRDAMGEFRDQREPVRLYAERRYPELLDSKAPTTDWLKKIDSIELRNKLASALYNADVTVEETNDPDFELLDMKAREP